jgi:hypothetical protein
MEAEGLGYGHKAKGTYRGPPSSSARKVKCRKDITVKN